MWSSSGNTPIFIKKIYISAAAPTACIQCTLYSITTATSPKNHIIKFQRRAFIPKLCATTNSTVTKSGQKFF